MTRADLVPAARDEDTALIEQLRRKLDDVTDDRDELLVTLELITNALRLPPGVEVGKVIARLEELTGPQAAR